MASFRASPVQTIMKLLLQDFFVADVSQVHDAGQLVYHGPREEVVPFFASCGFQCPPRKAVPDFLQELTSRKDQQASPF